MIVFLTSGWLATALRPAPKMLIRNNAMGKVVENLTLADDAAYAQPRRTTDLSRKIRRPDREEIFLSGEV